MRVSRRGKNGIYQIYFRSKGRTIRESAGTTNREEAEQYLLKRVLQERESGTKNMEVKVTIGQAIALFQEGLSLPLSLHDRNVLAKLRMFQDRFGPTKLLESVSAADLTRWMDDRKGTVKAATIRKDMDALSRLYSWAMEREYVESNPARSVRKPTVRRTRKAGLTIEQVRKTLETVRGTPLEPAYLLAFGQGLRRGEIAAARFDHVDLEQGTLYVPSGKTDESQSTLPLNPAFREWLEANWQDDGGPIVRNRAGTAYHPASLENLRREQNLRGADLPNFHLGRHTLGTILVRQRTDMDRVSKLLRHSSVRTTESYYAHLRPVDCRDDLGRMDI